MKNKELIDLFQALQNLKGLTGVKFTYAVAKNLNLLLPEVKAIETASASTEAYQEYDTKRAELAKKHAKKDANDKPISENNQFIIDDMPVFDKELKALKEEHKEAIEKRKEQIKELDELLEKESSVTLHKIKLEDVPEAITTEQMTGIYPIIED